MLKICEEDLRKVVWLSDPDLSPDGETAAWVRAESEFRTGKNRSVVMIRSLSSGEALPASRVTRFQTLPRFSPDGRFLAFLSEENGFSRLWLRDLLTGEERALTDFHVSDYAWSPSGDALAVCRTLFMDREGREQPVKSEAEYAAWRQRMDHAPRFTERLMYKLDEAFGFLPATASAICLVDVSSGESRELARESFVCSLPSFSADGKVLYYYGQPGSREQALSFRAFRLDLSSGCRRELPTAHSVSPAMPVLEWQGLPVYAGFHREAGRTELFVMDAAAGTETPLLSPDGAEGLDPALIGDDRNGSMGASVRRDEDGDIFFLTARECRLYLSDLSGRVRLSGGCIQGFSAPRGNRMLFLRSTSCHPGELFLLDLKTGAETRLTHDNDWIAEADVAPPEPVPVIFGDRAVHGWALLPPGEDSCPAVLYIHGGPECFYGEDIFFFEALSLRAAGFAVLWCNPRGSAGYGSSFAEGAYGSEAVEDLLAFVEACCSRFPRLHPARIGVTGGSYGGYMTNKLTLLTDRFKAAAAQRTWIDPVTSYGTGDMGFISGSGKTDFRAYMLERAKGSVLRDIQRLNTPTLILHGERDVRCGEEQADQLFNMIRLLRPEVPCRLVIFPGENHGLTRTGRMHNRIRHMKEIRQWMEHYLSARETEVQSPGRAGADSRGEAE